ncbi:protein of unknown function [Quadrisphaera sp. DSM 44207]|nr:protein of unknown function [Quadrisphaera sp. DSM 44207]
MQPSAEQAREWARQELAEAAYREAQPGLLTRLVEAVLERLGQLQLPAGSGVGQRVAVVLLLLLLAVLVLVALRATGRVSRRAPRRLEGVLGGSALSAAEHRAAADRAARAGDWQEAVRARFRAVVTALAERDLVDAAPGTTAAEAAAAAGRALPDLAAALAQGARAFEAVSYGGRPASAEDDARLRALDDAVAVARPVLPGATPAGRSERA